MTKHNANLYAYLDKIGVLEHGTDAEIKAAKRAYRKAYITSYRRAQRADKPESIVQLSKKNGDYGKVLLAAKRHRMTIAAFIRKATLAYLDKTYILPSREVLVRLDQMLMDCLDEVKSMVQIKERNHWDREEKIDAVAERIGQLQRDLTEIFSAPSELEHEVLKAVRANPNTRARLLEVLNHADQSHRI